MAQKTRTVKYGTSHIAQAMRVKYPSNAYAVLFEVGNATGTMCSRHCDALVMSLWPSRGLDITGFEFKASRSDWIKELRDPEKAELILQYCDYWSLVVTDEKILMPGELPPSWGMMVLSGKTLKTVVEPKRLEAKPWPREFLASVMRSVSDPVAAIDQNALRQAEWDGRQAAEKRAKEHNKRIEQKIEEYVRKVTEFESETGIRVVNRWGGLSAKQVGNAIKALSDGSHRKTLDEVESIRFKAEKLARDLAEQVDGIKAFVAANNAISGTTDQSP